VRKIAKTITIRLDEKIHREFKIYSVKKGKDMTEILLDHINQLLKEEKNQDKEKSSS